MADQFDFAQQWLDSQKKMMDFWTNSMGMQAMKEVSPFGGNIFEESMKPAQDMMKKWMEYSNGVYGKAFNASGAAYPQEMLSRMLSSATMYQNLMKFWNDLNTTMMVKDADPAKFISKWNEEYMKMVSANFIPYLPEQMKMFFNEPFDIYKMMTGSGQKFFNPWMENAQKMQALLPMIMTGDQNAMIELSKLWNESFSASYGKMLGIPEFSLNRDSMYKFSQGLNAWVNYTTVVGEFMATLMKANQETFETIVKEYMEMASADTMPKTFKEFYEYWWRKNENAYMSLFSTDEFIQLVGKTLDAGVNFKKNMDNLMEEQLKFLPYPSRTDMDSVYLTLDDLKREVRALKKEVASMKEANKPVAK